MSLKLKRICKPSLITETKLANPPCNGNNLAHFLMTEFFLQIILVVENILANYSGNDSCKLPLQRK